MKIRTFLHSIRESFHNVFSHPLLTLASVTTMTLMLTLVGAFLLFSVNANRLVHRISQEPPVEVFLHVGATSEQIHNVEEAVKNFKGTLSSETVGAKENFEKFKESMGEDGSVLDYFDSSQIPASLIVKLRSPEELQQFCLQIEAVPGVDRIDYNQNIADTLIRINRWINIGSIAVFVILSIIAFFIIANMVRISVFSRGAEIEIMKYIGATNWYIRFPYALEGAIIGLFGAIISWVILYFAYHGIYDQLMRNTPLTSTYALYAPSEVAVRVALVTGVLGVGVGMIGSALSVRRHIKV